MKTSRHLRSVLFYHLLDHLSVEHPTWEMVAMVMFTEVSPMPAPQAAADARLSHARHCAEGRAGVAGGLWLVPWRSRQPTGAVCCGSRGLSAVLATSV